MLARIWDLGLANCRQEWKNVTGLPAAAAAPAQELRLLASDSSEDFRRRAEALIKEKNATWPGCTITVTQVDSVVTVRCRLELGIGEHGASVLANDNPTVKSLTLSHPHTVIVLGHVTDPLIGTLAGHWQQASESFTPIRSIDISPDGENVLTCADDFTAMYWSVGTLRENNATLSRNLAAESEADTEMAQLTAWARRWALENGITNIQANLMDAVYDCQDMHRDVPGRLARKQAESDVRYPEARKNLVLETTGRHVVVKVLANGHYGTVSGSSASSSGCVAFSLHDPCFQVLRGHTGSVKCGKLVSNKQGLALTASESIKMWSVTDNPIGDNGDKALAPRAADIGLAALMQSDSPLRAHVDDHYHDGYVMACAVSEDASFIVTAGYDGMKRWDSSDGRLA